MLIIIVSLAVFIFVLGCGDSNSTSNKPGGDVGDPVDALITLVENGDNPTTCLLLTDEYRDQIESDSGGPCEDAFQDLEDHTDECNTALDDAQIAQLEDGQGVTVELSGNQATVRTEPVEVDCPDGGTLSTGAGVAVWNLENVDGTWKLDGEVVDETPEDVGFDSGLEEPGT